MFSGNWIGAVGDGFFGDASGGPTSVVWVGRMSVMTVCRGWPEL